MRAPNQDYLLHVEEPFNYIRALIKKRLLDFLAGNLLAIEFSSWLGNP